MRTAVIVMCFVNALLTAAWIVSVLVLGLTVLGATLFALMPLIAVGLVGVAFDCWIAILALRSDLCGGTRTKQRGSKIRSAKLEY